MGKRDKQSGTNFDALPKAVSDKSAGDGGQEQAANNTTHDENMEDLQISFASGLEALQRNWQSAQEQLLKRGMSRTFISQLFASNKARAQVDDQVPKMTPTERPTSNLPENNKEAPGDKYGQPFMNEPKLKPGDMFGENFRIISYLGQGGMSEVYRAVNIMTRRTVALKFLLPYYLHDSNRVKRFKKEGRLLTQLDHPNCVKVYSAGIINGVPYLEMEYLSGVALNDYGKKEGNLYWQEAVNIFLQVCDGLAYSHEKRILHRDLKPSNIFLTRTADNKTIAKLIDFGIAKQMEDDEQATRLTRPDNLIGSVIYMSPEQLANELPLDERSDIYSFGIVMYECLTERLPFNNPTPYGNYNLKRDCKIEPLGAIRATEEWTKRIQEIIFKCLQFDREQRYKNVRELKQALKPSTVSGGIVGNLLFRLALIKRNVTEARQPTTHDYSNRAFLFRLVSMISILLAFLLISCFIFALIYEPTTRDKEILLRPCVFPQQQMPIVLDHFENSITLDKLDREYEHGSNAQKRNMQQWYQLVSNAEISRLSGNLSGAAEKYNDAFTFAREKQLQVANSLVGAEAMSHWAYCYLFDSADARIANAKAAESLQIFRDNQSDHTPRSLLAYAILGRSSYILRDDKLAAECFKTFNGNSFGQSIERVSPLELALGSTYSADFYKSHGHYDVAAILYQHAVSEWIKLGRAGRFNLAVTFYNKAKLELAKGDLDAAGVDLESVQKYFSDNESQSVAERRELAKVLFGLAQVKLAQNDLWEFLDARRQALQLWW